jgi:hypothetical protein
MTRLRNHAIAGTQQGSLDKVGFSPCYTISLTPHTGDFIDLRDVARNAYDTGKMFAVANGQQKCNVGGVTIPFIKRYILDVGTLFRHLGRHSCQYAPLIGRRHPNGGRKFTFVLVRPEYLNPFIRAVTMGRHIVAILSVNN